MNLPSTGQQIGISDLLLLQSQQLESTVDSIRMDKSVDEGQLLEVCQIMHLAESELEASFQIKTKLNSDQNWKQEIQVGVKHLFQKFSFEKQVPRDQTEKEKKESESKNTALLILYIVNKFWSRIGRDRIQIPDIENFWGVIDYYYLKESEFAQERFFQLLNQKFKFCLKQISDQSIETLLNQPINYLTNQSNYLRLNKVEAKLSQSEIINYLNQIFLYMDVPILLKTLRKNGLQLVDFKENSKERKKSQNQNYLETNFKSYYPILFLESQLFLLKLSQSKLKQSFMVSQEALLMIGCPQFHQRVLEKSKNMVENLLLNQANGFSEAYYLFFQEYQQYQITQKKMKDKIHFTRQNIYDYLTEGIKTTTGVLVRASEKSEKFFGLTYKRKIIVNFGQIIKQLRQVKLERIKTTNEQLEMLAITSLSVIILHEITHFAIRKIGLVKQGFQSFDGKILDTEPEKSNQIQKEILNQSQLHEKKEVNNESEELLKLLDKVEQQPGSEKKETTKTRKQQINQNNNFVKIDRILYQEIRFIIDHKDQFLKISDHLKDTNTDIFQKTQYCIFQDESKSVLKQITSEVLDNIQNNKIQWQITVSKIESINQKQFSSLISFYLELNNNKYISNKFQEFKKNKDFLRDLYRYISIKTKLELENLISFYHEKEIKHLSLLNRSVLKEFKTTRPVQIAQNVFGSQQDIRMIEVVLRQAYQFGLQQQKGLRFSAKNWLSYQSKLIQINEGYIVQKYLSSFIQRCAEFWKFQLKNVQERETGWIMENKLFRTFGQKLKVYHGDYQLMKILTKNKNGQACQHVRWRFGNRYLNDDQIKNYAITSINLAKKVNTQMFFLSGSSNASMIS